MRRIVLAGMLMLASTAADAACRCACVSGRAVAACSSQGEMEPICSQICPEGLTPGALVEPLVPAGAIRLPGPALSDDELGRRGAETTAPNGSFNPAQGLALPSVGGTSQPQ
ncbi:hypothetical protein [Methylobacterium gregans]|uniref:Uncharacterized protein n=1 Tax=Methylobacterium gregans TaxID=374424 RepID=A0AA37HPD6_9HYPH|nr:hypothetical protein [Methylobacterium gregans]MDQ0520593.1 hypothetical protein [Methylobacterium gregans]GJD79196.1 hypothetical protein NBEOAGPD_2417 [Methylobacterium gregans]